jgi:hypothetical protein
MLDILDDVPTIINDFKNDIHCLGIVFLYIQIPDI